MFNPDYVVAIVTAGGVGLGAGRWASHLFKERGAKREEDAALRHSITGWPEDQFNPHRPGLLEITKQLNTRFAEHVAHDEASFQQINDKLDSK